MALFEIVMLFWKTELQFYKTIAKVATLAWR